MGTQPRLITGIFSNHMGLSFLRPSTATYQFLHPLFQVAIGTIGNDATTFRT